MNDDNKIFSCLGMIFLFVGFIIISTVMKGWAISTLWAWFVVPVFDLPTLTIAQAIGISMVISIFTLHTVKEADTAKKPFSDRIIEAGAQAVFLPLIFTFFGYLVKLFM